MPDAENTGKNQEIEIGPVSERGGRDCRCSVLFWFCCSSSPPGAAHPRRCVLPPATRPASGAASPWSPRCSESPAPRIPGAASQPRCSVWQAAHPHHGNPGLLGAEAQECCAIFPGGLLLRLTSSGVPRAPRLPQTPSQPFNQASDTRSALRCVVISKQSHPTRPRSVTRLVLSAVSRAGSSSEVKHDVVRCNGCHCCQGGDINSSLSAAEWMSGT